MQVPEANGRTLLTGTADSEHRRLLQHFVEHGLPVDLAEGEALPLLRRLPAYDVVIIPHSERTQDGLDLLREARRHFVPSRVLVVVQTDAEAGYQRCCLSAFEQGADDCVRGTCPPLEILARTRALHRRGNRRPVRPSAYHFGGVQVDFRTRSVSSSEETFVLTCLEGRLLHFLVEHKGRSVHREQLLREVWDHSADLCTRTVDRHVGLLRKKLAEAGLQDCIHTICGFGYVFGGVRENQASPEGASRHYLEHDARRAPDARAVPGLHASHARLPRLLTA